MHKAKLVTLGLVSIALVVVILQNRAPVQTKVLFASIEMPLIILLSLTALGGFAVGLLAATLMKPAAPSK